MFDARRLVLSREVGLDTLRTVVGDVTCPVILEEDGGDVIPIFDVEGGDRVGTREARSTDAGPETDARMDDTELRADVACRAGTLSVLDNLACFGATAEVDATVLELLLTASGRLKAASDAPPTDALRSDEMEPDSLAEDVVRRRPAAEDMDGLRSFWREGFAAVMLAILADDEGRDVGAGVHAVESRRPPMDWRAVDCAVLAGAGVIPPVPRTPP